MSFKSAQLQNFNLAGSGVSIGDTTMTLSSFQTIDGVDLALSDFGSAGYMTIEPGSKDREEQIAFYGVTQNSNGTCTLTGIKTVLFLSPYTETSGFSKSHPGGVVAVVTNTSGFYNKLTAKDNQENITGYWTVPDPLSATGIANKEYVDNLVNGGTVSTNALIEIGTAGETISAGNPVYLKAADGRWWKATGATAATVNTIQLGIAQGAGTAGNAITGGVLRRGIDTHQSGGAAGSIGYISDTSTISTSAGTTQRAVGNFATATTFVFDPDYFYIPTAVQKAGLASTTAPSSTNLYVTQKDAQIGAVIYGADSVGTDAYAITVSPTPAAYVSGMTFRFKAGTANTGACTLNVNSLGATAIKKNYNVDTATGDIVQNQIVTVTYDGTNFQMQSPATNSLLFNNGSTTKDISSTTTTTIAHGIGVVPKRTALSCKFLVSNTDLTIADAVYIGSTQISSSGVSVGASTTYAAANAFRIYIDGSQYLEGTITTDATNISIAWTKTGSPTGTATINWEVMG